MSDHVYRVTEIVGTSSQGLDDAIQNGARRAAKTLHHLDWFEVTDIRGHFTAGVRWSPIASATSTMLVISSMTHQGMLNLLLSMYESVSANTTLARTKPAPGRTAPQPPGCWPGRACTTTSSP